MSKEAYELLGDTLSGPTRSNRRSVLVYTSILLLITYTGIAPSEPSVLGFEFPGLTEKIVLWSLLVLAFYSYISFLSHFASDFKRYRFLKNRLDLEKAKAIDDEIMMTSEERYEQYLSDREFEMQSGYKPYNISSSFAKRLAALKMALDCWIPIVYGGLGLVVFFTARLISAYTV